MCANFLTVARKSLVGESGEVFAGGSSFRRAEKSRDPGNFLGKSVRSWAVGSVHLIISYTRQNTHWSLMHLVYENVI